MQTLAEKHGSKNYRKQQRVVAHRYATLKRKRHDFLHKFSNYYAWEYGLMAVEDLDARGLVELPDNNRNRAGAAWGTFLRMLDYKCEHEGTHFIAVNPRGTIKEYTQVVWRRTNRYGYENTCVHPMASRETAIRMLPTTPFLADSPV